MKLIYKVDFNPYFLLPKLSVLPKIITNLYGIPHVSKAPHRSLMKMGYSPCKRSTFWVYFFSGTSHGGLDR